MKFLFSEKATAPRSWPMPPEPFLMNCSRPFRFGCPGKSSNETIFIKTIKNAEQNMLDIFKAFKQRRSRIRFGIIFTFHQLGIDDDFYILGHRRNPGGKFPVIVDVKIGAVNNGRSGKPNMDKSSGIGH